MALRSGALVPSAAPYSLLIQPMRALNALFGTKAVARAGPQSHRTESETSSSTEKLPQVTYEGGTHVKYDHDGSQRRFATMRCISPFVKQGIGLPQSASAPEPSSASWSTPVSWVVWPVQWMMTGRLARPAASASRA